MKAHITEKESELVVCCKLVLSPRGGKFKTFETVYNIIYTPVYDNVIGLNGKTVKQDGDKISTKLIDRNSIYLLFEFENCLYSVCNEDMTTILDDIKKKNPNFMDEFKSILTDMYFDFIETDRKPGWILTRESNRYTKRLLSIFNDHFHVDFMYNTLNTQDEVEYQFLSGKIGDRIPIVRE